MRILLRQVVLRPVRIGILALLGGLVAVVLAGADGWWFMLGITLFQVAVAALMLLWVQNPAGGSSASDDRSDHRGRDSGNADDQGVHDQGVHDRGGRDRGGHDRDLVCGVPRQRRPRADE